MSKIIGGEYYCPRCNKLLSGSNRLVTDDCGHQKCMECLLSDEAYCLECKAATNNENCDENQKEDTRVSPPPQEAKKSADNLPEHIRKINSSASDGKRFLYECTICSKTFSRTQKYYHYSCNDPKSKKYKCEECGKMFSTKFHLNYHLESHQNNSYRCVHCPKSSFKNVLIKRNHEKLHSRKKDNNSLGKVEPSTIDSCSGVMNLSFPCNLCERKYKTKASLKQHLLKHKEKAHECSICGKRFQRQTILRLHMKRHEKTEKFMCSTCYKNFSDADSLKRHYQIHNDECLMKFKCQLCDTTTKRKDNMLRHVRNMHSDVNIKESFIILREAKPPLTKHSSERESDKHKVLEDPATTIKEPTINEEPVNHPKTVANSSVIRFVGNVEPIKVPNLITTTPIQYNPSEQVHNTKQGARKKENVKKAKKPFDPLEIYRKILNTENDDESLSEADDSSEETADTVPTADHSNSVAQTTLNLNSHGNAADESLTPHHFALTSRQTKQYQQQQQQQQQQERYTVHGSNFSETHWRKNFKFVYQHQKH